MMLEKQTLFQGSRQKLLGGFFPLYPLSKNHIAKKTLAEMGVPPPPLTENPLSFSGKNPTRAKNDIFGIK